ncbi:abscisic acid receptor PYL11-like [Hibiscus syriacus]|uniref:abscisic acid receptor PYL11-like n=1 Tax=Hibiscus syriacus TaxID=106335 RepID=UPI0019231047|nr:abscisic acid receptor PYL11-like [Hibiscus syriacus]
MLYNRPSNELQLHPKTEAMRHRYHTPNLLSNQCGSSLVQIIDAPLPLVWSIIRRFDNPQAYKQFVKSCKLSAGNGGIGSIREVMVMSGLPAASSTERLDELDDERHVMMISIIGGDHKLVNYRSTATLHEIIDGGNGGGKTMVVESYVVDVPAGNSKEDTCCFANMIIACNLRSLARVTEKMAKF